MSRLKFKFRSIFEYITNEISNTTFASIPYIASGAVSAIVCSVYMYLFKIAEKLPTSIYSKWGWLVFIIVPLSFLFGKFLVDKVAPGAAGSGIPQVIASVAAADADPKLIDKLLSLRVAIVKIISSSFMVMCGSAVGREGPSIQISTSMFYVFQQLWIKWGFKIQLKNMLVAGGAGGLAAAFNTPLGGIIYAVEELARDHLSNFRIGLLEAVITAGLVAQLINGRYLFLGFPKVAVIEANQYLPLILIAIVCGFLGAIFGWLLFYAIKKRMLLSNKKQYVVVFIAGLLFALMIFALSKYAIGSGKILISEILFKNKEVALGDVISRFFGPILASISGASGGVFAPALAAGAALGDFLSELMVLPANNIWTLCGMVAFLTGLTKTPVTSLVLVLEMTDRHSVVFPIMLSALIAQICSRIIEKNSFYEKTAQLILNPPKSH